ncbi:hypothetical protein PAPYR_6586 [Paratrimastix pyriformis]|uniref:Uncharacterized protein n=1 Tax=Paratrimastix pyriformis TaxID=342808 RepID=A0ABQ8UEW6_9EUKA|nr:hypothetical protein PAPYR_6586 [Paratrimastix pyriformis]
MLEVNVAGRPRSAAELARYDTAVSYRTFWSGLSFPPLHFDRRRLIMSEHVQLSMNFIVIRDFQLAIEYRTLARWQAFGIAGEAERKLKAMIEKIAEVISTKPSDLNVVHTKFSTPL